VPAYDRMMEIDCNGDFDGHFNKEATTTCYIYLTTKQSLLMLTCLYLYFEHTFFLSFFHLNVHVHVFH